MDIALYVLIAVGLGILLLAMWGCAASGVNHWGPDLTYDLPPYLMREVFLHEEQKRNNCDKSKELLFHEPTAPSKLPYVPLLKSGQPIEKNDLPKAFNNLTPFHSQPFHEPTAPSELPYVALLNSVRSVEKNDLPKAFNNLIPFHSQPVRVLPHEFIPIQKLSTQYAAKDDTA